MTSTFNRTNSAAISAARELRPSAQRYSIVTVRPSIQPRSRSRCTKAATDWLVAVGVLGPKNPMTGCFAACCARAASGNAAAALPRSVMNSRRLIVAPEGLDGDRSNSYVRSGRGAVRDWVMSALGQKRTYALQQAMSALLPIATAKAKFRERPCPVYRPKADMCGATRDVRFGPIADIGLVEVYKQPRGWLAPDVYQPQRRRPADPDPYARWSTCRNNLRGAVHTRL